jgi:beta-lactam-binding protein with PASTA domain
MSSLLPLAAVAILVISASAGAVISSQTSGPRTRDNSDAQLTSRACGPATFKAVVGHKLRYAESLARAVGISPVSKARLPSNAPAGTVIGYNLAKGGDSSYCSSIVGLWVEVSSGPQRDMRQTLQFATTAPSHSECATPITISGDENFGPATCGTSMSTSTHGITTSRTVR